MKLDIPNRLGAISADLQQRKFTAARSKFETLLNDVACSRPDSEFDVSEPIADIVEDLRLVNLLEGIDVVFLGQLLRIPKSRLECVANMGKNSLAAIYLLLKAKVGRPLSWELPEKAVDQLTAAGVYSVSQLRTISEERLTQAISDPATRRIVLEKRRDPDYSVGEEENKGGPSFAAIVRRAQDIGAD